MCFDVICYAWDDFEVRYNAKDKVKRRILLLNKIRFEKKIKYLVMG